jgi:predicted acyltransferase (DUF342 family)
VLLPYRISQGTNNSSVLSNPANSLNYLTIFNNQNAIEYLPSSTSSSLTDLGIEATTIPNTLITDNETDVLTLKNTSCEKDARIVLGNTMTGHPDASANYAAIGGEYAKPDDNKYGKMNFYIRDNSTDLIQVATIDSSGLSIEDISANTITSQSAIVTDISATDISVYGTLTLKSGVIAGLTTASIQTDASNVDISGNGSKDALMVTQPSNTENLAVFKEFGASNPSLVIDSSGHVIINKDSSLYNFDVSGTSFISDTLDVSGNTHLYSKLTVDDDVDISGNLSVKSKSYFEDDVSLNANVDISGILNVYQDASFNSGLTVQGKSLFSNDVSFNSNVDISGILDVSNGLIVRDDATFHKNVDISENATVGGTLDVSGVATFNNALFNKTIRFGSDSIVTFEGSCNLLKLHEITDTVGGIMELSANNLELPVLTVQQKSTKDEIVECYDADSNTVFTVGQSGTTIKNLYVTDKLDSSYSILHDVSASNLDISNNLNVTGEAVFTNDVTFDGANTNNIITFNNNSKVEFENVTDIKISDSLIFIEGTKLAMAQNNASNIEFQVDASGHVIIGRNADDSSANLLVYGDASFNSDVNFGQNISISGFANINHINAKEMLIGHNYPDFTNNVTPYAMKILSENSGNNADDISYSLYTDGQVDFKIGNMETSFHDKGVNFNNKTEDLNNIIVDNNIDFEIKDNLLVGNDVDISGNLDISSNLTLLKNADICGNVEVWGDVSFNSNLDISKNLLVKGTSDLCGNVVIYSNLSVHQDFNIDKNLEVNGTTTLKDDVSMNSRLDVDGDVSFNSNLDISENLTVHGDVSMNSRVDVIGDVSMNSTLYVNKSIGIGKTATDGFLLDVNGPIRCVGSSGLQGQEEVVTGDSSLTHYPDGETQNIAFLHIGVGDAPVEPLYKSDTTYVDMTGNNGNISTFGNIPKIISNLTSDNAETTVKNIITYGNSGEKGVALMNMTLVGDALIGNKRAVHFSNDTTDSIDAQIYSSDENRLDLSANKIVFRNNNETHIEGTLEVDGKSFVKDVSANDISANNLSIYNHTDLETLHVNNTLTVDETSTFNKDVSFNQNVDVDENLYVAGELSVIGDINALAGSSQFRTIQVNRLYCYGDTPGPLESGDDAAIIDSNDIAGTYKTFTNIVKGPTVFLGSVTVDGTLNADFTVGTTNWWQNLSSNQRAGKMLEEGLDISMVDIIYNIDNNIDTNYNNIDTSEYPELFNTNNTELPVYVDSSGTILPEYYLGGTQYISRKLYVGGHYITPLGKNKIIDMSKEQSKKDTALEIEGNANFQSHVDIQGNLIIHGYDFPLNDNGGNYAFKADNALNTYVNRGKTEFRTDVEIINTLIVGEDVSLNSNVDISGNLDVSGSLTTDGINTFNNKAYFGHDIDISTNITSNGDIYIYSNNDESGRDVSANIMLTHNEGNNLTRIHGKCIIDTLDCDNIVFTAETAGANFEQVTIGSNATIQNSTKLLVGGQATFNNIDVTHDIQGHLDICGNVEVGGDVSFNSNLDVSGIVHAKGEHLTVDNKLISLALTELNYVDVSNTLTVTGDVSLNSNVDISENLTVLYGDVTFNQRLDVIGDVSLNSNVDIDANLAVHGDVLFNQRLDVIGDVSFNSNVDISENLTVHGDASFNSNVDISENLTVHGDASFNSNVDISENLIVYGDVSFNQRLDVIGDVSLNSNVDIVENLHVHGDVSFNDNSRITQYDIAFFDFNGQTSAPTDGANFLIGGSNTEITLGKKDGVKFNQDNRNLEIYKNTSFHWDVSFASRVDFNDDVSFNNPVDFIQDVSFASHVDFNDDVSFNNPVDFIQNVNFESHVDFNDDVSFNNPVDFMEDVSFASHVDFNADVSFNTNIQVTSTAYLHDIQFNNDSIMDDTSFNIAATDYTIKNSKNQMLSFDTSGIDISVNDLSINNVFLLTEDSYNNRVLNIYNGAKMLIDSESNPTDPTELLQIRNGIIDLSNSYVSTNTIDRSDFRTLKKHYYNDLYLGYGGEDEKYDERYLYQLYNDNIWYLSFNDLDAFEVYVKNGEGPGTSPTDTPADEYNNIKNFYPYIDDYIGLSWNNKTGVPTDDAEETFTNGDFLQYKTTVSALENYVNAKFASDDNYGLTGITNTRIVLKCMVKFIELNTANIYNTNNFKQNYANNYGPCIEFNGTKIWGGINHVATSEKWHFISVDLTPYIEETSNNTLKFKLIHSGNESSNESYFYFKEVSICIDDTPWWLLSSNYMHVNTNLGVSTTPTNEYTTEISGNTYLHYTYDSSDWQGDPVHRHQYALNVDGSCNFNGNVKIGNSADDDLPYCTLDICANDGIIIPRGDGSQRPVKAEDDESLIAKYLGTIRYNTEISSFEGFGAGNSWGTLGGVIDVAQSTYITAEDTAGSTNPKALKFYVDTSYNGKYYAPSSNDDGILYKMILDASGCLGVGQDISSNTMRSRLEDDHGIYTSGYLAVDKDVSFNGRLDVSSDVSFNSDFDVSGDVYFNQRFDVSGDVSFNSDFDVSGDVYFNQRFDVNGDVSFNSDLDVSGITYLHYDSNTYVNKDRYALNVDGSCNFNGNVKIGNSADDDLPYCTLDICANDGIIIPRGDGSQRPVKAEDDESLIAKYLGTIRYNTEISSFEGFGAGNTWGTLGGVIDVDQSTYITAEDTAGSTNPKALKFYVDTSYNGKYYAPSSNDDGILYKMILDASGCLGVGQDISSNTMRSRLYDDYGIYTSGYLAVDKDVSFNGRLDVSGDVSFNSDFDVSGDVYFNQRLDVYGDVSFNSDLDVSGDVYFNQRFDVSGDVSFNSDLDVSGDVYFNQRFDVSGDVSFNSDLDVSGDVYFNQRLDVYGDVSFNSDLDVSGDVYFNQRLDVSGDVSFNSDFDVSGDVYFNQRLDVSGDVSFNSDLDVSGDVYFNQRFDVSGDVSFNSDFDVSGDVYFNQRFDVSGDVSFNSDFDVSGDVYFNQRFNVSGDVSFNSDFDVSGDVYFNQRFNVSGDVSFNSNLDVIGTTTANAFVANSDYILKENIVNLTNPLERTCSLTGRNYNWKRDPSNNITAGLIAQEVESIIPEVINRNGQFLGVNYNSIIPYLIESIKSQQERINDLEERINFIEDRE